MCNIWKNENEVEITPEGLGKLLADPLYSELAHVGVTGGEPTLREDIIEVYEQLILSLPALKGLSIITNAIEENTVKQRISQINELCLHHGVPFSAMVSIDGYKKTHDRIRGIKNNFESAYNVYTYLNEELKVPTTFGCTISKKNVWEVDDLLYFAQKNNMRGRFRVAEFINRLYNEDRDNVIRNFTEDETYHLVLFFEKLKQNYENSNSVKRTYTSIQNMLLGGERLIGCPYHNDGIVVGSKGQINYCAPKSNDIGNGQHESSLALYRKKFHQKEAIVQKDCKNCIHDYHAPITYNEKKRELNDFLNLRTLRTENADLLALYSNSMSAIPIPSGKKRVFIVGWYGTETVGDKAILGGIVQAYETAYGSTLDLVIGSLYPFVTQKTCKELNINATVVSTKTYDLLRYAKSADEVVMGGGPLMDLNELYVPLIAFKVAKINNIKTVIQGCGLGPLHKDRFKRAVKNLLELATVINLRDSASVKQASTMGFSNASLSGDFARPYIKQNFIEQNSAQSANVIRCFLREWTYEYSRHLSIEEFQTEKKKLEAGIAQLIREKAEQTGCSNIRLEHMHNFVVGNDDRDFSRYFIETYFSNEQDLNISFNPKLATVENIVSAMQNATHNICMRFHSVLFAQTLKLPFTAIDYTRGGKIQFYLEDCNQMDSMIPPLQLIKS
ncbi:polysaccharide pyruvyl transferase family protein [Salinimonas marina]|uniref:Polysaccharide pyruvyl transferase family protein n=2 Tax=Salinimonas marina TaxID=2785918 RepID=A0A7S9HET9_9ALTE|nr:polysaccharide pyruvyl transferase family protein [Salinimonas marina]